MKTYRNLHKHVGLALILFVLASSVTGLLLAWKKEIDVLQPPTQTGENHETSSWKSIEQIITVAKANVELEDYSVDRVDFRPSHGVAKVRFEEENWEVQVDCTTLKVLSAKKRYSDLIESIHDGSILGNVFKLIAMNFLGFGLLTLLITGIVIWWRVSQKKRKRRTVST